MPYPDLDLYPHLLGIESKGLRGMACGQSVLTVFDPFDRLEVDRPNLQLAVHLHPAVAVSMADREPLGPRE
ncbi:hypothetical protein B0E51_15170 [Rhodanobacter sp. C05]|nr:hypothetical protein B0E51_15170 [Rhodanobacter sp. C05]